MRKFLSGVLAASMLFGSLTVFADDNASDIRKQILELTKELAEVSQTEGDITYNILEAAPSSNILACEITNNTEYTLESHPSFVARDDEGNLKFAYIVNNITIGAGDTVVVYQDMRSSDFMDRVRESTIEWGCWTEYSNYATCTKYVDLDITETDSRKLIIMPSVNDGSDGQYRLEVFVVFKKDDKVTYIAEDSLPRIKDDDSIEITYCGSGPYDSYDVYYTAYNR